MKEEGRGDDVGHFGVSSPPLLPLASLSRGKGDPEIAN